jgi:two-component system response regulator FixJ
MSNGCFVLFSESYTSMAHLIAIVDDDEDVRNSLCSLLRSAGYATRAYASARYFLSDFDPAIDCAILDICMPGMDGLALQQALARRNIDLPIVVVTGNGDVPLAVRAIQAGAIDFIEKPFTAKAIFDSIGRALKSGKLASARLSEAREARDSVALLTSREQVVLRLLVDGHSNKTAAHNLGISPRTLESHRANIMDKMHARNFSDVMRVALAAH